MKLHRLIIVNVLALAVALSAFAHGGHKHQFLGTVKSLRADALVVTTTEKKDATFTLTPNTTLVKGTAPATRADLKAGARVSVYVENDGKTAKTIKIAQ